MPTATKNAPVAEPQATQLAVIPKDNYLALRDNSDVREALEANLSSAGAIDESLLVRVPIPSQGVTQWTIPEPINETTPEITGILVLVAPRGVLWQSEEVSNALPVLVSHDLKSAHQVGPIPDDMLAVLNKHKRADGTYDWVNLPYNQFGTGKNGVGKRAKESRMMFVLRQGEAFPLVVGASPGSLKNVKKFIMTLTVPHWRAVVSLTLAKEKNSGGTSYSQIVPRLVGTLSREDGEVVRKMYTEPLKKVAQNLDINPEHADE